MFFIKNIYIPFFLVHFEEELNRIIPVLSEVKKYLKPSTILSVDTYKTVVAQECLKNGVTLLNDVYSNRFDGKMFQLAAKSHVPIILMHSRGNSKNMTSLTNYNELISDVSNEMALDIEKAKLEGVSIYIYIKIPFVPLFHSLSLFKTNI